MKNLPRWFGYSIVLLVFSSCSHCPNGTTTIDYPAYMHKYFHVFMPGCYFLYLNQDSTKHDSIYITDYYLGHFKADYKYCRETPQSQFTLHSEYLSSVKETDIIYEAGVVDCQAEFGGSSSSFPAFNITTKKCFDTLYNFSIPLLNIDTLMLWKDTTQIIEDVWLYKYSEQGAIYFAPDIGIAQYITNNSSDTFTVTKVFFP